MRLCAYVYIFMYLPRGIYPDTAFCCGFVLFLTGLGLQFLDKFFTIELHIQTQL